MTTKIILPEMGEGVIEGTIARWLKQEGEAVEEHEPLLEIETDKVTTEAEAEASGVLLQILVPEGETVPVGTVLGVIGRPDGAEDDAPEPQPRAEPLPVPEPAAAAPSARPVEFPNGGGRSFSRQTEAGWVSPVVARMAAEYDLDLTQINGTGLKGRITKDDVLAYLETREEPRQPAPTPPPPQPLPAAAPTPISQLPSPPASGELLPLTTMRRAIADHMVLSKRTSPHVTTVFEVDFSTVTAHRQAHKADFAAKGAKLTFTPYLMLAIAQALQEHPLANSSWQEDGILLHREINIGMATALNDGAGLIVPVVRGADGLNLVGMARMVNDLAERARGNKLKPEEVKGGTFTLTNHGVSGSLLATPIINQPQCGILGVGAIQKRVVVVTDSQGQDAMAIRPMAYLSFTFDHRILDGATADHFVARIKDLLETWREG